MEYARILEGDLASRYKRVRQGWRKLGWQLRAYWAKLLFLGIITMGVSSLTTLSLTSREVRTGANEEGVEISMIPREVEVKSNQEQSWDILLNAKNHEVVSAKLVLGFEESIWEFVDLTPSGPMDEVVELEARMQGEAKLSLGIKPHMSEGKSYLISPVTGNVRVARLTLRARKGAQGRAEIRIRQDGSGSMVLARASGLTNVLGEVRGSEVWVGAE